MDLTNHDYFTDCDQRLLDFTEGIAILLSSFVTLAIVKRVGNILIILAGAVLLSHTLLSHAHHSELNETQHFQEHETASSLFDYLQLAFHFDPGQNHLEEYQTSGYDLSFVSPYLVLAVEVPLIALLSEDDTQSFRPYQTGLWIRYLHRSLSFRGPPLQSC